MPDLIMQLPHDDPRGPGWLREAGRRLGKWWLVKATGTTVAMSAFFVAYFWVLRNPLGEPTIMPLTPVDRWIGFWPPSLVLYASLWLYISLTPALIGNRRELFSFGGAWVVLGVIGLSCFYFWPTAVPRPDIDWAEHPSFRFLKSVDLSGNACPSLHVAFTVFSAVWFERLLRGLGAGRAARVFNWVWCLGILYSTIATRQHVSIDVLAGAVLGACVATVHLRWLNKMDSTIRA